MNVKAKGRSGCLLVFLLVFGGCNQKKNCTNDINEIAANFITHQSTYDSIIAILNSQTIEVDSMHPQKMHDSLISNNSMYKRLFVNLGVRTITKASVNEYGKFCFSIIPKSCSWIYSNVDIIFSDSLLPNESIGRTSLTRINPNWYIYTVQQ